MLADKQACGQILPLADGYSLKKYYFRLFGRIEFTMGGGKKIHIETTVTVCWWDSRLQSIFLSYLFHLDAAKVL